MSACMCVLVYLFCVCRYMCVWGVCGSCKREKEVKGEPEDDERQGADPWDVVLGHERSRVRGATFGGTRGWGRGDTARRERERGGDGGTPNTEPQLMRTR